MSKAKKISYLKVPLVRHVLYWLGIFAYFLITIETKYFSSFIEGVESRLILILMQIITAYCTLGLLIPRFLTPKKHIQFTLYLMLLLMGLYALFVFLQEFYFSPKYYVSSTKYPEYNSLNAFNAYILNFQVFAGKAVKFATPTIILLTIKFYNQQQRFLKINEQKKVTELATLRHQLNPHFLFNTLNNLYALSIEKSDEAPEVIAKLSEMLDYMLYGCNDQFVDLQKEVELIENYLALEKVRYSSRVEIKFHKPNHITAKIGPLILLTFIENAFKHGVSQELNLALITIDIKIVDAFINFTIKNSIPSNKIASNKKSIGLTNVKKQLELLYTDTYSLTINSKEESFIVDLKIPVK